MPVIDAPALRGNDVLGFLAALGVAALSGQGCIAPLRLAWRGGTAPHAVFFSEAYHSAEELGKALRAVAEKLERDGSAIPGVPPRFPYLERHPKDRATGADPMRMSREAALATYEEAERDWLEGQSDFARWLTSLLAFSALDRDGPDGRVRLTHFNAPFGQMKFRDSYFDQARRLLLKLDGAPVDAFTGWIRVDGYTGANIDERAIRDAALSTAGKPSNAGAPSATWLAVMSFQLFPLADDGRLQTTGWQEVQLYEDATRRSLVWPTWQPALDSDAIQVLLNHPGLRLEKVGSRWLPAGRDSLRQMGVTAVFGASRKTRTQGDGPLGPAVRLWPA